jgi:hypothetical protein
MPRVSSTTNSIIQPTSCRPISTPTCPRAQIPDVSIPGYYVPARYSERSNHVALVNYVLAPYFWYCRLGRVIAKLSELQVAIAYAFAHPAPGFKRSEPGPFTSEQSSGLT